MTTPEPRPVLSIDDAAELVGRSPRRVYEWLREHPEIRRTEIEGHTYVERESLLAYEATVRRGRPRKARP